MLTFDTKLNSGFKRFRANFEHFGINNIYVRTISNNPIVEELTLPSWALQSY